MRAWTSVLPQPSSPRSPSRSPRARRRLPPAPPPQPPPPPPVAAAAGARRPGARHRRRRHDRLRQRRARSSSSASPAPSSRRSQLYVRGGARDWTAADAGVERLALTVATSGGTEALDKDAFARKLAALGSDIGSESRLRLRRHPGQVPRRAGGTRPSASSPTPSSTPRSPRPRWRCARQRQLDALRHEQENPDALLGPAGPRGRLQGPPLRQPRHRHARDAWRGSALDALKAHLAKLRESSRLLFVTVGDVDPAHVVEKVRAAFGAPPARRLRRREPFPPVSFGQPSVTVTREEARHQLHRGQPSRCPAGATPITRTRWWR